MQLRLIAVLSLLAISFPVVAVEPQLDAQALQGIWKMVYAAGVKERPQYEVSSGFLIIMPGGKYYEIREDCCDPAVFMDAPRSYRIEAGKVILSSLDRDGQAYERTFRLIASTAVVFFDNLDAPPVSTQVLTGNENGSPNYGYGKVYP